METGKWRVEVNIPSGSNTRSGKVSMRRKSDMVFELKCSVPKCRFRRTVTGYLSAQRAAFNHAHQHQFAPVAA